MLSCSKFTAPVMNLSPPDIDDVSAPAAPADWTMDVGTERTGEGIAYFADVKRAGVVMCRLVHAGLIPDDTAARKVLAGRARIWIDDFLIRERQSRVERK